MIWPRHLSALVVLIVCAGLALSCGPKPLADLENTKVFEAGGVKFSYPGDWELSETEAAHKKGAKLQVVTVRAPTTGAFVTIQAFDHVMKLELATWAERFVEGYAKRFVGVPEEFSPGARTEVTADLLGSTRSGLRQDFEVVVGEVRQAHHVELYVVEAPFATLTVLIQASAADWLRGRAAFDLVLKSLESTRTEAPEKKPAEPRTIEIVVPEGPDGEPDWGAVKQPNSAPASTPSEAPAPTKVEEKAAQPAPSGP